MLSIIGQRIRKYRELKGWSQEELARRIGRSGKQTMSQWETGKANPSLAEIMKLSEALNATVAQLVGEAPMFEEPRENYIMVKKDDLIQLQKKALEAEDDRIKALTGQLQKALGSGEPQNPEEPEETEFEELP